MPRLKDTVVRAGAAIAVLVLVNQCGSEEISETAFQDVCGRSEQEATDSILDILNQHRTCQATEECTAARIEFLCPVSVGSGCGEDSVMTSRGVTVEKLGIASDEAQALQDELGSALIAFCPQDSAGNCWHTLDIVESAQVVCSAEQCEVL